MKRPGLARSSKVAFAVWVVFALALTAGTAVVMCRGLPVESDLLALLPEDERSPVQAEAIKAFQGRLGEHTLILVGVPNGQPLGPPAQVVCGSLRESPAFTEVICARSLDPAKTFELVSSHRWQLLNAEATAQLEKGDSAGFLEEAQAQLFSPLGAGRAALLMRDPLGLSSSFLSALERPGVSIDPDSGLGWVEGEGRRWVIIDTKNRAGAFQEGGPELIVERYELAAKAVAASHPGTELLGMGIAFHAAAAAISAKREMSTIGIGSWVGSILLVLFVFRTVRSLVLSTLVIGIGMAAGLLATIAVFGHVHVLTLVLGSSLAGVAIDYCLHVLSDSFHDPAKWDAEEAVRRLRWPLFLGMATSVIAYGSLALTPFPGLRELALFASVALFTAFGTVILSFPVFLVRYRALGLRPKAMAIRLLAAIDAVLARRRLVIGALLALGIFAVVGLLKLRPEDDIHTFQNSNDAVAAAEARARAMFTLVPENQFFLVTGPSADAVLQSETALRLALEPLLAKGVISSLQATSQHVPTQTQQTRNVALFEPLYAATGQLGEYLDGIGFPPEAIATERAAFEAAKTKRLSVDAWLASAPGEGDRSAWLGETSPGHFASVVLLNGITSMEALRSVAVQGAVLVDRVSEISMLMKRSRQWALALVGVAFALMWVMLALRYGGKGAVRALAPTAMACLVALAGAGLLGLPLNIFSTVALWLILGMGVDYSIFFYEAGDDASTTTIGVLVDAITTLLSFGLLSLSSTPALRSFGTVLSLGLASAFLFAPLARKPSHAALKPQPQ